MTPNDEIDLQILQLVEEFKMKSREKTKDYSREELLDLIDYHIQDNLENQSEMVKRHTDAKFNYLIFGACYGSMTPIDDELIGAILNIVPLELQADCIAHLAKILYKGNKQ
jgi:hypothetical protein